MNFLANILSTIGASAASAGTQGCALWLCDEPEMPNCLLGK